MWIYTEGGGACFYEKLYLERVYAASTGPETRDPL